MPWQLGSLARPHEAAAAAINTAGFAMGPHEVVVALIDSGVLPGHPSLKGQVLAGYDMLAGQAPKCETEADPAKYRTHGTEVASLMVGNGEDGLWGVNPRAKVLPVRLFGPCEIERSDLLHALAWSAGLPVPQAPENTRPAQVINLSFAGGRAVCGDDLQALLDRIAAKHIFVVTAVGNTTGKRLLEPANCRGVISVGALDAENQIQDFSALDTRTTLYAPGTRLRVATFERNWFGFETARASDKGVGTSYAAPLVSGFISLLLSHQPTLTPSEWMAQLPAYTRAVPAPDKCPTCVPRGLTMTPGH